MTRIVITMPAFQAEGTLERTIADIPAGTADELILVDDASIDNTVQLARDLGVTVHVHSENRGYGANQKTCYLTALENGADIVVLLHPDYQYDPRAVPLLVAPILGGYADMTFGSRFAGLGNPRAGGMPLYRFIGNRVTTILQNLLLGSRFTEMHSGLRAYTRDCLLSLPFLGYTDDFAFDSQMVVDAVTSGQRVVEVPIPTRYTKESSSISIVRSLTYISRSVLYAAATVFRRGRRGRRWPVAVEGPAKPPRAARTRVDDRVAAAISLAQRFVTPTKTMTVAPGPPAEVPGWDVSAVAASELASSIDEKTGAVVIDLQRVPDAGAVLEAIRPKLDEEALIALSVAGRGGHLGATLGAAGYRIVYWDATRGATNVMARPRREPDA